uniref:Coactosin-like protein n=1 Tax=Coturnix japonica TaxID=93934 RepID=A0A8C2TS44_COTJA
YCKIQRPGVGGFALRCAGSWVLRLCSTTSGEINSKLGSAQSSRSSPLCLQTAYCCPGVFPALEAEPGRGRSPHPNVAQPRTAAPPPAPGALRPRPPARTAACTARLPLTAVPRGSAALCPAPAGSRTLRRYSRHPTAPVLPAHRAAPCLPLGYLPCARPGSGPRRCSIFLLLLFLLPPAGATQTPLAANTPSAAPRITAPGPSPPALRPPSPASPPPGSCITPGPQEGRARAGSTQPIGSIGAAWGGPVLAAGSARLGWARRCAARCGAAAAAAEGPISAPLRGRQPVSPNVPMATKIDKEACREAYNLVRDDATEVNWVTFKYNGSTIVPGDQGVDYETFKRKCTDDVRLFGFVRFTTGDAMSKRVKFALITWIGEDVSGLQRAKTGTDKTLVKEVVQNFAKEFVISDHKELDEDYIKNELKKAGGANYDAQTE